MDARFARGGRDAFAEVYSAHAPDVRRWVRRFFDGSFEQEEAVQEVWLTAHRMQRRYDPSKGPLLPWLRALCSNRCRELLRAASRRPSSDVPVDDISDALWLDAPGPDDAVHSAALRAEVARFAATLPQDEARALQLVFVEQRSHAEVARELGIDERRSKYLKQKVLLAASRDEKLVALMREARS
ncbi:MAG: sigma-70 family RNA polymerase sigma factor [Myxococcaceae bacterium]|nr:sigma-70 family RNA polymerase sigma factor [Myxococcaceae bacterium]